MHYMKINLLPLSVSILFIITTSCQDELLKKATRIAKQYPSLMDVLNFSADNPDYTRAACFIVANTPEKERKLLNCDSLVQSIHTSIEVWKKVPWHSNYSQDDFFEYVLPYRIADEPLEYYWKWDYPQKLHVRTNSANLNTIAQEINRKIQINTLMGTLGSSRKSYSSLIQGSFGKCDDRAVLTTMAMRSYGIPAAFEYIPYWGNSNSGHSFCSVIKTNGELLTFQSPTDIGEHEPFVHKTPKVYRRMFSLQTDSPLYKYREAESIPSFFADFQQKDVTNSHPVRTRDVKIYIHDTEHKLAYLSVFSPDNWLPIAYAENKKGEVTFSNVGTGTEVYNEIFYFDTTHIEPGILYLPSLYIDNEIYPVGRPIIVSDYQIKEIISNPTITESVTLYRKYPLSKRIIDFASEMQGGIFEGANRKDFTDAVELYYVNDIPLPRMQKIPISSPRKFKYFRYRKPKGTFSLSEIRALSAFGNTIHGELIHSEALNEFPEIKSLVDNDCLSYFTLSQGIDIWVGIAFEQPETISAIEFCPRTDDNDISPGDQYELFYWHDEWLSLGSRRAEDYQLTFDNVPQGALLWLRDFTKGKEERPFTIDNGTQKWW